MPLSLIGLSHHTAPVALREQIAFTAPGALENALAYLKDTLRGTGSEAVLLSTCNRTELYLATPRTFPPTTGSACSSARAAQATSTAARSFRPI
jgi:glutamyl-tRNA reductase